MTKPLNILVVEDTPEFLEVSKKVYGADDKIVARYASTYEEAVEQTHQERPDGMITDLFFPSQISWVDRVYQEIKSNIQREIDDFKKDQKSDYILLKDFRKLSENPSGLGILQYCLERKIPLVVLSQGERHKGDLAVVRRASRYISALSNAAEWADDPLPQFMLYRGMLSEEVSREARKVLQEGMAIDKGHGFTWQDAIHAPYTGLLARIHDSK